MKNLAIRAFSGLIYALIIFFGTTINPKGLIVLMMVFGLFCLYEFFKITNLTNKLYQLGALLAALIVFGYYGKEFLEAFETNTHYYFHLRSLYFIIPVLFVLVFMLFSNQPTNC